MELHKLRRKYILSVIIDFSILMITIYSIITISENVGFQYEKYLILMVFIIFLIHEKMLNGISFGKLVFAIRIIPLQGSGKVSVVSYIVRRFLEIIYTWKIFIWRFHMNIDEITNSRIVSRNFKYDKQNISNETESNIIDIRLKRIKALLIDLGTISWLLIIVIFFNVNVARDVIYVFLGKYAVFVEYFSRVLLIACFVLKDMVYRNQSIGKKKTKIVILDVKKNMPSKMQIFLRNAILLGLFPIEIVLFIFKKRQIATLITFTDVFDLEID